MLTLWDANGVETFNSNTSVIKFLGTVSIGEGTGNPTARTGTIVDPRFSQYAGHSGWWARSDGGFSALGYDAVWHISGNTINWTWPRDAQYITLNGQQVLLYRPRTTIMFGIR